MSETPSQAFLLPQLRASGWNSFSFGLHLNDDDGADSLQDSFGGRSYLNLSQVGSDFLILFISCCSCNNLPQTRWSKTYFRTSLAIKWLRLPASTAKGAGSIPDRELRSHVLRGATKEKKKGNLFYSSGDQMCKADITGLISRCQQGCVLSWRVQGRLLLIAFSSFQKPPTGEGNGNPLQYSCLENPMDREAWWATVHEVAKSRKQLSD